jgi:hypothetical protein
METMKLTRLLISAALILAGWETAAAYTLSYSVVTHQSWTGSCGQAQYPANSSFLPTDPSANVYFEINGVASTDQVSDQWIQPDGSVYASGQWGPTSGNRCYEDVISISGSRPASMSGIWHARVFVSGAQLFDLTFQIGVGPTQPSAPSYTGSFDNVDCSHIYGWAEDKNNPGSTITVDILVDGSTIASSVPAGDARTDLSAKGIGPHAFDYYGATGDLKDGFAHSVQVRYGGTSTYLPGSPISFQNPCTGGTIGPSNVQSWIYDSSQYNPLNGFSIRLDKEHLSDGKYQYRISVTPDYNSRNSLDSAQLILLRPNAVTFDHTSSSILINHDSAQEILGTPALDWQIPPSPSSGPPNFVKVILDIVGLLNPEVGTIQGLAELANDLASADPTVGPSTWFEGMMNDDNNFHVSRFFIGQQVHLFSGILGGTYGIRFVVNEVDESSGQAPQFLAIAKDSSGAIIGAEIGLDRKILASRAQGRAALQYIIVF